MITGICNPSSTFAEHWQSVVTMAGCDGRLKVGKTSGVWYTIIQF